MPYRPRPVEQTYSNGSRWYTWLVEDQRFVDGRPDVLTWQSDVLTDDITVTEALLHICLQARLAVMPTGLAKINRRIS